MSRRAVILYNAVASDASSSDADVLVQLTTVRGELERLGWEVISLPATLDLAAVQQELQTLQPLVVFNLVESLGSKDRWGVFAAEILEGMNLPFTGCPNSAIRLSNDKLALKRLLISSGLPTPAWSDGKLLWGNSPGKSGFHPSEFILKPVSEHASVGMTDDAVVHVENIQQLNQLIQSRSQTTSLPFFGEAFVAGREFNLSLLEIQGEVLLLPPAEILFDNFPAGKPRIVGYAAKWEEKSFEYHHTPRCFEFSAADGGLLEKLKTLAKDCWRICGLRGYARVDFRVDDQGQPWILEINANPCLSPDGGFAAAVQQSGMSLTSAVEAMLDCALATEGNRRSASTPLTAEKPSVALDLRAEATQDDIPAIRRILASTQMFRPGEIDVAAELLEDRLTRGTASGYEFLFAEQGGRVVGYACYGRNTMTVSSFDLYWIAVEQVQRGRGLGTKILGALEQAVVKCGGTRIYLETSHRPDYYGTRAFYERHGYFLQALLPDYYAPGDDRAIFVKSLT